MLDDKEKKRCIEFNQFTTKPKTLLCFSEGELQLLDSKIIMEMGENNKLLLHIPIDDIKSIHIGEHDSDGTSHSPLFHYDDTNSKEENMQRLKKLLSDDMLLDVSEYLKWKKDEDDMKKLKFLARSSIK